MKIERIERARMSATLSTLILSGAWRGQRDRVGHDDLLELRARQPLEGGAGEDAVRRDGEDPRRTRLAHHPRRLAQRAGGVDHVVDQDRGLAGDVADDVARLGDVVLRPLLGDESRAHAELAGELLRQLGAAGVRRDGDVLLGHGLVEEVLGQHRPRDQVIDGDLEEALDLARVQVHGEHAVGAGRLEHVGDEPGGDRLPRRRLLVLARVAEPGRDGDDPVRGRALGRVDHQEQLHQVPVHRRVRRLDDEDVRAADRLQVAAVDLAVREGLELDACRARCRACRRSCPPSSWLPRPANTIRRLS